MKFFLILFSILIVFIPSFVFAEDSNVPKTGLQKAFNSDLTAVAKKGGYSTSEEVTVESIVGDVINAFLGLLGVIFIALIVWGGYLWMTDMGNSEKVQKAKSLIGRAIIGLVITVGAYGISYYVVAKMAEKTMQGKGL